MLRGPAGGHLVPGSSCPMVQSFVWGWHWGCTRNSSCSVLRSMCNGPPGWGQAVCLRLQVLLGQVCTHLAAPNSAAVFSTALGPRLRSGCCRQLSPKPVTGEPLSLSSQPWRSPTLLGSRPHLSH